MGIVIGARRGEWFEPARIVAAFKDASRLHQYKVLDTSVIIDGRIADICETGFLDGTLVVPQFVLRELQQVADSSDSMKRNRGRRGLDVLQRVQKMTNVHVQIVETDFPEVKEVDLKLIELAKRLSGKIVTNDFNLNKVAQLRGVAVLNINELANSLKPVVLPGEVLRVFVLKEGKEAGQGVAYLDDGTMVVVDQGKRAIGRTIEVTVTSVLQTTAGKMIFCRWPEASAAPAEGEARREPRPAEKREDRRDSRNGRDHRGEHRRELRSPRAGGASRRRARARRGCARKAGTRDPPRPATGPRPGTSRGWGGRSSSSSHPGAPRPPAVTAACPWTSERCCVAVARVRLGWASARRPRAVEALAAAEPGRGAAIVARARGLRGRDTQARRRRRLCLGVGGWRSSRWPWPSARAGRAGDPRRSGSARPSTRSWRARVRLGLLGHRGAQPGERPHALRPERGEGLPPRLQHEARDDGGGARRLRKRTRGSARRSRRADGSTASAASSATSTWLAAATRTSRPASRPAARRRPSRRWPTLSWQRACGGSRGASSGTRERSRETAAAPTGRGRTSPGATAPRCRPSPSPTTWWR